jgi:patatin-like phospholipase/acyl hydrolase
MNMVELRILTIWTILTKMSFLTISVANLVLDVANLLHTSHGAIILLVFSLSLQKSLVELHLGFSMEISATGFANPVPPGFPEGTFNRLVQASILCPFS